MAHGSELQFFDVTDNETGILLMGVTGHGKSATGNSIIGRREFVSRGGGTSVTKDYHAGYTTIHGRTVKVVDIPGFIDTDESNLQGQHQLVINALTKVLTKFPNGFHAVLLVVSYSNRVTEELQESLRYILRNFGEDAFKTHGILVLTYGDSFERDYGQGASVGKVVAKGYEKMMDICGGRCVLFDNITRDDAKRRSQVDELLAVIDNMTTNGVRYIPSMCKYNGGDLVLFEKDRQRVAEMETISCRLGLLKDHMYTVNCLPEPHRKRRIVELKKDVYAIIQQMERLNATDPSMREKQVTCLRLLDDMENGKSPEIDQQQTELISGMQKDLDNKTKGNSFWKTIEKGFEFVAKITMKILKMLF